MKDALGHGSDGRGGGGGGEAHVHGIAAAHGIDTGHILRATAWQNPKQNNQDYQERTYHYNGSNSKAAVNWALKKIQNEFPDHREHGVDVIRSPSRNR